MGTNEAYARPLDGVVDKPTMYLRFVEHMNGKKILQQQIERSHFNNGVLLDVSDYWQDVPVIHYTDISEV